MDAVALLHRAQEVGLHIEPIGDKLLVRGPKRAEPWSNSLLRTKRKCWRRLAILCMRADHSRPCLGPTAKRVWQTASLD